MSQHSASPFTELRVAEVRAETSELTHVSLTGALQEFLGAFKTPGQYVQIKTGENKPAFFAIACAPNAGHIELLIKRGSPVADAVARLAPGEKLLVSAPGGKGYPLEQAIGCDLVLIGVGSGIAPLRSVMHRVLERRNEFGRVWFIYGARTSCAIPYQTEMDGWGGRDIQVTHICSQPVHGSWPGRVGRVQDVLLAHPERIDANSAVFVCGMKAMVEDVKAAVEKLGLARERVFQNF